MDTNRPREWTPEDIANLDKTALSVKLPTLQEVVCYHLAITVWNYGKHGRITRFAESHYLNKLKCLEPTDCDKYIETLGIPRPMKAVLKKCFKKLCEETIRCVIHFKHRLFSTKLEEYKISQVDWNCFLWFPNGEIDYKNTAIKMLSSSKLTEEQKFAIMCKYCLENELNRPTFDLEQLSTRFIDEVSFENDPLIFYWIHHLKNELHRIPLRASDSLDGEMATKCRVETCEAFEYFWDRLSQDDPVEMMILRLNSCYTAAYKHCRLLRKMSHEQLMDLLFRQPVNMILASLNQMDMPRCAIWAWIHAKDVINDDQFARMIHSLLRHNDTAPNGKIHYDEEKMSAFLEIWDTATDSQRKNAADNHGLEDAIVDILCYPYITVPHRRKKISSSGLKFVLKALPLQKGNFQRTCYQLTGLQFLLQNDFDMINEILEFCLPDPSREESFIKSKMGQNLIKTPYCCEILYSDDDYDELNQRLRVSFENVNFSSNFVKELIAEITLNEHKKGKTVCYKTCKGRPYGLENLRHFINDILPQYPSSLFEMKNSLVSSLSTALNLQKQCVILHELCKVIEVEFVNEHLTDLKHRCVEFFKESNLEDWIEFIASDEKFFCVFSWCFDNDREKLPESKHALPIVSIFYESFRSENFKSLYPRLCVLDECLKYHFSDCIDELVEFKLSHIQHPSVVKIFNSVAKYDEILYEELFQWFNSYDLNSISEPADPRMEAESPAVLVPILSRCNFSG